ncbi:MAG: hypothetical protein ACI4EV_03545 [Lachnospiraceae bacterium]
MGLLKFFKNLRSIKKDDDFDIEQFVEESPEYSKQLDEILEEVVDVSRLNEKELETYVKSQCEAMEDANRYMAGLKQEYDTVADYYSDIQLIDNASDETKRELASLSKAISELTVDRRMYKGSENKLSNHKYYKMEMAEKDMPKALADMQNNESYVDTVTKDMRLLEGEKMSIKLDIKELNKRKNNIRQLGKMIVIIMGIILVALIAVNLTTPDEPNYAFLIVCALAVIIILILFTLGQTVNRGIIMARKKYAKCITLLNKVKIKYINAANTLDYSYSKYDVKNSYEFSRQYEIYLTMKAEQKKMLELTEELNHTEERLLRILRRLQLNDCEIWLKQVRALADPKEMVEIRHSLSVRRKKLREQIEFNQKKIDECKGNIMQVTASNPHYKELILSILDRFEG